MISDLSKTIEDLNNLYHTGLNGDKVQQKIFTDYVDEIRSDGIIFVNAKPKISFENVPMNDYESKLYEKLQLMVAERRNAIENKLWRYATSLSYVQSSLVHELSTLLMKRGAIEKKYFWEYSPGRIAFNWSGHAMDMHVWWEESRNYDHLVRVS